MWTTGRRHSLIPKIPRDSYRGMSEENVNAEEREDSIKTFILSGNVRGGRGGEGRGKARPYQLILRRLLRRSHYGTVNQAIVSLMVLKRLIRIYIWGWGHQPWPKVEMFVEEGGGAGQSPGPYILERLIKIYIWRQFKDNEGFYWEWEK